MNFGGTLQKLQKRELRYLNLTVQIKLLTYARTYETADRSSKEFRRNMSWTGTRSSFASGLLGSMLRAGAWMR